MKKAAKKIPKGTELFRQVDTNGPGGTYLLLGEEDADKEDFISHVASSFKDHSLITSRFNCATDSFLQAADHALSADMFQPNKLIIITNIEDALKKKSDVQLFHDMVTHLPAATILILSTHSNKMNAALSRVADKMHSGIFWRRFENELASYITKKLKDAGKSISQDAVGVILQLCGRNRASVDEALHTLIYGSEQSSIDRMETERMLSSTRETTVFECVDALFERRKDALTLCAQNIESGSHELLLLTLIARKLHRIEHYVNQKAHGVPTRDILRELGIIPRQQPLFEQTARRFTAEKLRSIAIQLYTTEKSIKSGGTKKNILANPLSDLIYSIIT